MDWITIGEKKYHFDVRKRILSPAEMILLFLRTHFHKSLIPVGFMNESSKDSFIFDKIYTPCYLIFFKKNVLKWCSYKSFLFYFFGKRRGVAFTQHRYFSFSWYFRPKNKNKNKNSPSQTQMLIAPVSIKSDGSRQLLWYCDLRDRRPHLWVDVVAAICMNCIIEWCWHSLTFAVTYDNGPKGLPMSAARWQLMSPVPFSKQDALIFNGAHVQLAVQTG